MKNSLARNRSSTRRGAALVEGAIVLSVLLTILFTILDLGLATIRENTLAEGARRVARVAAVRGSKSTGSFTAWGTTTISTTASADANIKSALQPIVVAMPLNSINVKVEWPDGTNTENSRVRVTLTYSHQPMVPLVLGSSPITLKSVSTMRIAH